MKYYKEIIVGIILLVILFLPEKTISGKNINDKYKKILATIKMLSEEKKLDFEEYSIDLLKKQEKLPLLKFSNKKYIVSKKGNYFLDDGINIDPWNNKKIYYQVDIDKIEYDKYLKQDTDGGGIINKFEIEMKTNPKDPSDDNIDFDGDGFPNLLEKEHNTNFMNIHDYPSLVHLFKISSFFVNYVPIVLKNILSISKNKVYFQSLSGNNYFLDLGDNLAFKDFVIVLDSYYRDKKNKKKSYAIINIYNKKDLIQTIKMFIGKKYYFTKNFRIILANIYDHTNKIILKNKQATKISVANITSSIILEKIISKDEIHIKYLKDNNTYIIKR